MNRKLICEFVKAEGPPAGDVGPALKAVYLWIFQLLKQDVSLSVLISSVTGIASAKERMGRRWSKCMMRGLDVF